VVQQASIVVFRVDGSYAIGLGHVKRCLALAHALRELGARVVFVSRPLDAAFDSLWASSDVPLLRLPKVDTSNESHPTMPDDSLHTNWLGVDWRQDARETIECLRNIRADWLVVDHYALDARWHEFVKQALGVKLLAIDDLANRKLAADVLVDQNWAQDYSKKYATYLSRNTRRLLGPRYALLSKAYRDAPRNMLNQTVKSIGIFMGGTDVGNASAQALKACRSAKFTGVVEIVTTNANPQLHALAQTCALDAQAKLTVDELNLIDFLSRHGLYIGAGGGATWERCCLAVPTIALALADNQVAVVEELNNLGALLAARFSSENTNRLPSLEHAISQLLSDLSKRHSLAKLAGTLVDGYGALRVGIVCLGHQLYLRRASMNDAKLLFDWRNHPAVRAVSRDQKVMNLSDHLSWFEHALSDSSRLMYVAEIGGLVVGSIRFDQHSADTYEVSLYTNPALVGLGLGQRMLDVGTRELTERTQAKHIVAEVLPGNESSGRLFTACGYRGGPYNFRKNLER
jgi:UDP-2,4-diacetamido-2,4,6-trideoxy-beta-L-altropyranose hydrolase